MNTYSTEDLYLAAFLVAQNVPVIQWNRDIGLTNFVFEESTELSQLVGAYYADQVKTSPLQYGNALKNLKSMIHSKSHGNTSHHNHGATK
jgi:Domain of unknown function (DUF5659)